MSSVVSRRIGKLAEAASVVLVATLVSGCASTEVVVVSAARPALHVGVDRFTIGEKEVEVLAKPPLGRLQTRDKTPVLRLTVAVQDEFEARGFNRSETWKLMQIAGGHAIFDVRGRIYGCTDPFAIFLGIPSGRFRRSVIVCPHIDGREEPGE